MLSIYLTFRRNCHFPKVPKPLYHFIILSVCDVQLHCTHSNCIYLIVPIFYLSNVCGINSATVHLFLILLLPNDGISISIIMLIHVPWDICPLVVVQQDHMVALSLRIFFLNPTRADTLFLIHFTY
jgi:hypothetical protein